MNKLIAVFHVALILAFVHGNNSKHQHPFSTPACTVPGGDRWFNEHIFTDSNNLIAGFSITTQNDIIKIVNAQKTPIQTSWYTYADGTSSIRTYDRWLTQQGSIIQIKDESNKKLFLQNIPNIVDKNIRSNEHIGRRPKSPPLPADQNLMVEMNVDGNNIAVPITISYDINDGYSWVCDQGTIKYKIIQMAFSTNFWCLIVCIAWGSALWYVSHKHRKVKHEP